MISDYRLHVNPPLALACATCGRPLGTDPEDEPDGDAGLPICGECNRERNSTAIEEVDLFTQTAWRHILTVARGPKWEAGR